MENDVFEFGNKEKEQHASFEYDSLSGLGESNYENEDLFALEQNKNSINGNYKIDDVTQYEMPIDYDYEIKNSNTTEENEEKVVEDDDENKDEMVQLVDDKADTYERELDEDNKVDNEFLNDDGNFNGNSLIDNYEMPIVEPSKPSNEDIELSHVTKLSLSNTSVEELNKLTEYKEEKINTTDIKALFDRVGVNVKEASDIFKKNTEMKEKIDTRFEELKKLQIEVEKNKKSQYDEINSYKEEVLAKLTEKKEEIEKRLNKLKDFQANLEKEKEEFEKYKKREKEEIDRVQKEIQDAYDSRREELTIIEDKLRRQKDALDEERSQLSLDRIQYESDKNELANNLLKFNDIVDSFTNGIDKID